MELQGKIINVLPMLEGTSSKGNVWKSQPYVLETEEKYPKKVYFEVFGEESIKRNPAQVGDVVTISIDIESVEYNGKWFTKVRAWKIEGGSVPADCTFDVSQDNNLAF